MQQSFCRQSTGAYQAEGEDLCLQGVAAGVGPLPLLQEGEEVGAGRPCRLAEEGQGVVRPCHQEGEEGLEDLYPHPGAAVGAGIPCCRQEGVEVEVDP